MKTQINKTGSGLFYTTYINRPLGRKIAEISPDFITPNIMSAFSFLVFCSGCIILLTSQHIFIPLLFTSLMLIQYALDSADGVLARIRGQSSAKGEWLDHSLDSLKISILHFTIVVMFMSNGDNLTNIELAAFGLSVFGQSNNFTINQLKAKILRKRGGEELNTFSTKKAKIIRLFLTPADQGLYFFIFIAAQQEMFTYLYLTYGIYYFIIMLMNFSFTLVRS